MQYLIAEPQVVNKMPQNWPRPIAYCWSLFAGFCNESPPTFCFTFGDIDGFATKFTKEYCRIGSETNDQMEMESEWSVPQSTLESVGESK